MEKEIFIEALVLAAAIFFSVLLLFAYVSSVIEYCRDKPGEQHVVLRLLIIMCALWGVYYHLTHT